MTAPITAPGISDMTSLPGNFLYIVWGAGNRSNATMPNSVWVCGDSNGTATSDGTGLYGPDTATPLRTYQDAVTLFGVHSELTQFFREFTAVNQDAQIYVTPISDTGTKGTVTITVAGTAATIANSVTLSVNGYKLQVPVAVGDTPTTLGATISTMVNMLAREITAANVTGVVTVTAGSAGARNTPNAAAVFTQKDPGAGALTITVAAGTAGTSTISTSAASAIATMGANKFYYQVMLLGFDESSITATVVAHSTNLNTQSLPLNDNRCRGFAGFRGKSTDALYATQFGLGTGALATSVNNPLYEAVWAPANDNTIAHVLARYVAWVSLIEVQSPVTQALNLNYLGLARLGGFQTQGQLFAAPRSRYTETKTAYNTALNSGVTCIGYQNGQAYLMRRVTSDAWDPVNSVSFFNIRDPHKVFLGHRFALDLQNVLATWTANKQIGDDPEDPNDPIPPATATPLSVAGGISNLINKYGGLGLVQNSAAAIQNMNIQRGQSVRTRFEIKIPLVFADICNQFVTELDQVG